MVSESGPLAHGSRAGAAPAHHYHALTIMNRLLSVVRSRTDKSLELSRAALTVPRYGESNRLVGVD